MKCKDCACYKDEWCSMVTDSPDPDMERDCGHFIREQRWIPVTERLPEKQKDVLIYFENGNAAVGFWHDQDEDVTFWCAYTDGGYYTDCEAEPTHWMPLPEPPEVNK